MIVIQWRHEFKNKWYFIIIEIPNSIKIKVFSWNYVFLLATITFNCFVLLLNSKDSWRLKNKEPRLWIINFRKSTEKLGISRSIRSLWNNRVSFELESLPESSQHGCRRKKSRVHPNHLGFRRRAEVSTKVQVCQKWIQSQLRFHNCLEWTVICNYYCASRQKA